MKLVLIDYDTGNVQSVKYALQRLGADPLLTGKEEDIRSADKVILPGVGAAGHAMESLRKSGLDQLIPDLKQPVLGVCLGMQLMCSHSAEHDTECLDIFPMEVRHFPPGDKVPHMGWNTIGETRGMLMDGIDEGEFCYFVHSYYVPESEYTIASSDYILKFSASIEKDNFYACQFHPEKSGSTGSRILKNFLEL